MLWDHPISYTDRPQQYFLMYYLVDTNRDNGCLRVIPGSHRKRHPLHDLPRQAHQSDEVGTAANLEHPALQPAPGEADVPVHAGDVVGATRGCSTPPTPTAPASAARCSPSGTGPPTTNCPSRCRR